MRTLAGQITTAEYHISFLLWKHRASYPSEIHSKPSSVYTQTALVMRVIDGDMVELSTREQMRLLGVET